MNFGISVICFFVLRFTPSSSMNIIGVGEKFSQFKLVPDIINTAPTDVLMVAYNASLVNFGDELSPDTVAGRPTHIFWNANVDSLYTFLMADPDAPYRTNATYRSWRHYVVVNIVGSNISSGTTLSSYIGPEPPANTGLHRYAFLVYKQSGRIDSPPVEDFNARRYWNITKWALDNNLGNPVAGNFFQSRNADDDATSKCAAHSLSLILATLILFVFFFLQL